MRIMQDRFYVGRIHPGISGFKDWDHWEYYVVMGRKARQHRSEIVTEYIPKAGDRLRLEDGHLPEYQPEMDGADAIQWLRNNPDRRVLPSLHNYWQANFHIRYGCGKRPAATA